MDANEVFGEVIHAYSRADALADGVLVDISEWSREAGFKFPVAVTSEVWAVLEPSSELKAEGQDTAGRAWDLLTILRHEIRRSTRTDKVHFAPLFVLKPAQKAAPVKLWAKCGPGDDGETPTITVMIEGQD